jgi:hypothetical protein
MVVPVAELVTEGETLPSFAGVSGNRNDRPIVGAENARLATVKVTIAHFASNVVRNGLKVDIVRFSDA